MVLMSSSQKLKRCSFLLLSNAHDGKKGSQSNFKYENKLLLILLISLMILYKALDLTLLLTPKGNLFLWYQLWRKIWEFLKCCKYSDFHGNQQMNCHGIKHDNATYYIWRQEPWKFLVSFSCESELPWYKPYLQSVEFPHKYVLST